MRRPSLSVLAGLLLLSPSARAFSPGSRRFSIESRGRQHSVKLYALPPVPPPPPVRPEAANVLDQIKELAGSIERVDLSQITDKLPKLELPALQLELPALPKLELTALPKLELGALKEQIGQLDADILSKLEGFARSLEAGLLTDYPSVQPIYQKVTAVVAPLVASQPSLTLAVSAVVSYLLVSQILTWGKAPPPTRPYPLGSYDALSARAYFDQRPLQVVTRGLQIVVLSLQFGLSVLKDKMEYVL